MVLCFNCDVAVLSSVSFSHLAMGEYGQTGPFSLQFYTENLLEIICILGNDEIRHSRKCMGNSDNFSLRIKTPTKNANPMQFKTTFPVSDIPKK